MGDSRRTSLTSEEENRVEELLCTLFDERELRAFATAFCEQFCEPTLPSHFPRISPGAFAGDLVRAVVRRGAVSNLLCELARVRPWQRREIGRVADLLGFPLEPTAVGSPYHSMSLSRSKTRSRENPTQRLSASIATVLLASLCAVAVCLCVCGGPNLLDPPSGRDDTAASTPTSSGGRSATVVTPCQSELHDVPDDVRIELNLVVTRRPELSHRIAFPWYMDTGRAAEHIFTEHILHDEKSNGPLLTLSPLELCTGGGQCFGEGTSLKKFGAALALYDSLSPLEVTMGSGLQSVDQGERPLKNGTVPPKEQQQIGSNGESFFSLPQHPNSGPTFNSTFVSQNGKVFTTPPQAAGELMIEALACDSWDDPCEEVHSLPEDFARDEFTVQFTIRLSGEPRSASEVDPYSGERWWEEEQALFEGTDASGRSCSGTALLLTASQGLRWIIDDGADVGPGDAWSISGEEPENSLLDGNAHKVALVRRWVGTTDAQFELWVDGVLEGQELSDLRSNLYQRWVGEDGLKCAWQWTFGGELSELRYWDRALDEAKLESPHQ